MSIEEAELGKLTKDHLYTHDQVSRQKAELEKIGEDFVLLGNNLKKHPQNIRIGEAKITLKADRNEDRIVLWSTLDIISMFHIVVRLSLEARLEVQEDLPARALLAIRCRPQIEAGRLR